AIFQVNTWFAIFATSGVILSACYALWLYRKIIWGALEKESLRGILDLNAREVLTLVPLVILTIVFGFYPAPILDATYASAAALVDHYLAASGLADAAAQAGALVPAPAVTGH